MAYTGKDYFLQVKLSDNTQSKVRDAEIDALMQTKGAILTSNGISNNLANFTSIAPGTTNQILAMGSAGLPVWTSASAAAGVNDADLNIKLNSANATKLFSANSNTAATLSFASGSTNGAIAINGTDVAVKGLKSAAFQEASAFDAAGAAATAEQNAKTYTDGKISDLGKVMTVVGTGASLPASGTNQGDVYIVTSGTDAGKEYVWTGSAWELLGQNEIDLSGYVQIAAVTPVATTNGVTIATIAGKTISIPAPFSGNYNDLANAPTSITSFTNDAGYITGSDVANYAPVTDVKVIGYNDADYSSVLDGTVAKIDLSGYATVQQIAGFANISDVPHFSSMLSSGTLIANITQNGTTTPLYAPSVPTNLSELNNDAGFITAAEVAGQVQANWTQTNSSAVDFIKNKPTLGGLASKNSVSVPANTFATDITATANNQAVVGVGATGASKISAFSGGAAAFTVENGVLSLDYTAATLTYGNATASTLATINVNNYSATKNSAMTLS